jgi:hypothetical protein
VLTETKMAVAQENHDLPEALLARAAVLSGPRHFHAELTETPLVGVSAFEEPVLADALRASTGHQLPEVSWMWEKRLKWMESDTPLGSLASSTAFSEVTGCMSFVEEKSSWRDDKGYIFVRDPRPYGLGKDKFGTRGHKIAYVLQQRLRDPAFELKPGTPIDHICRFTGCSNPYHVMETNAVENNKRQREALALERLLVMGQIMIGPTGFKWIDELVERADQEDTGVIINTGSGPHKIIKLDNEPTVIVGEPLVDDLLSVIKQPSQRRAARPSRAKKPRPIDGSLVMFPKTKYRKQSLPTQSERYKEALSP